MLSHLEFPRLKRLELDTRKFEPGPLPTNPLTRRGSDLEAYKVLFSSPNLVELDFGNGCALALPLYLEALDPLVLQGLPDRLTTLSIYVNRQDNPANLRVLSRCKRLKCLELLSVSDILQKSSLATIIPAMSCILFSLEVLHIDQSAQEWKYYSFRTISEKEGLPEPPHVHLKELHLRGTTNWVGVFLKNNDSSGMESLRLQLLVRGSQTVNLDHLCGRNFSKLKRLEISLYFESESSDHGGYPTTWITPDRHFSPEKLLSILNTMPVLNHLTLGSHEGWDRSLHRLELEMDDHFLSKLGDILPRLEHLSIKNDLKSGKWTSTGFIALGRRCRYLTYFNVGGRLDITDPMFEEELRQTDIRSVSGGRDQSGPAANFSPLFPFLRTLAITSLPPRTALSDEYPPETYPRAPPETLTRIVHLITAHFPRLSSISRFETDPLLQMELRRKRTTLDWPMNRLSHFASPWYARFATQQVKWKFETRRREGVTGDAHDSDSNSEVDLECARGVRDGCYKDLGVFGSKEVK
ncbi:hypothetical protein FQN54_007542 [Arachnomyces sp. PD_36]|nr:hypothetical protein FQN54_007542 [Arachnomyces sp. PD_36]